ncbi:40022_t:CDS:2, partial [Gigaspora margarita]
PKTSIESKMIESANEVKNFHFLTLVLNYINDPFTFFFISLVCKLWKRIAKAHDFWENLCNSLEFDPLNPQSKKYKLIIPSFSKMFINYVLLVGKILNFYEPTSIFKTKVNYDFCEYLVDELEPLVDSSIVKGEELKLCSDCTIKKKESLFNSIRQLKDSIYIKLKE